MYMYSLHLFHDRNVSIIKYLLVSKAVLNIRFGHSYHFKQYYDITGISK